MFRVVHSIPYRVAVVVAALLLAAVAVLPDRGSSGRAAIPAIQDATPDDPGAIERGAAIFAANCITCHGTGGKGDGPAAAELDPKPADLTSAMHSMHTDAEFVAWITNGIPGSAMPAFAETLTEAEIADVVAYIRSLQAAADESPDVDVPGPEDCTVAPRSPEEFRPEGTVTPQPAPTALPVVGADAFPWPQGEPASQDEIDGITRTLREFQACENAGDYPRRLALYTDRAIRPQFQALDEAGWKATLDFAATPPVAVPEGQRGWVESITWVRRLPDGRVGAYVVTADPVNHPHRQAAVVVFVLVGDRWLIDEVHRDPEGDFGDVPAEPAGAGTPVASGDLIVELQEATAQNGMGTFTIAVQDAAGEPVTGATVEIAVEMPGMNMSAAPIRASETDPGRYEASAPLAMSGAWHLSVTITGDGFPPATVTFEVAVS